MLVTVPLFTFVLVFSKKKKNFTRRTSVTLLIALLKVSQISEAVTEKSIRCF